MIIIMTKYPAIANHANLPNMKHKMINTISTIPNGEVTIIIIMGDLHTDQEEMASQ